MAKTDAPIARRLTPREAVPCQAEVTGEMQARRGRRLGAGCSTAAAFEVEGRKLCRRHAASRVLDLVAVDTPKRGTR